MSEEEYRRARAFFHATIDQATRRHVVPGHVEKDDLSQEAALTLWRVLEAMPSVEIRSARFWSYFQRSLYGRLIDCTSRYVFADCRDPSRLVDRDVDLIDPAVLTALGGSATPEEHVRVHELYARVARELDTFGRIVLREMVCTSDALAKTHRGPRLKRGLTAQRLAEFYDVPPKVAERAMQAVRAALTRVLDTW